MPNPTLSFVALSFGISMVFGLIAFAIGREQTFESPRALPALLITIWSPNIAAVVVTEVTNGSTMDLIAPLSDRAPLGAWALACSPLAIATIVGAGRGVGTARIGPRLIVLVVAE